MTAAPRPEVIDIAWGERRVRIEQGWINRDHADPPLTIFLHEGLGSLAKWKDFPPRLCAVLACRGLVYSRKSTASKAECRRPSCWRWTIAGTPPTVTRAKP